MENDKVKSSGDAKLNEIRETLKSRFCERKAVVYNSTMCRGTTVLLTIEQLEWLEMMKVVYGPRNFNLSKVMRNIVSVWMKVEPMSSLKKRANGNYINNGGDLMAKMSKYATEKSLLNEIDFEKVQKEDNI